MEATNSGWAEGGAGDADGRGRGRTDDEEVVVQPGVVEVARRPVEREQELTDLLVGPPAGPDDGRRPGRALDRHVRGAARERDDVAPREAPPARWQRLQGGGDLLRWLVQVCRVVVGCGRMG